MIIREQVISIKLTLEQAARARFHAGHAEVGGRSNVRGLAERQAELTSDQIIGQLGQVGLHLYLYGHLANYETSRWMQNQFPTKGDGGFDIPGALVDVKTSLVRTGLDLMRHRLPVRPHERHADATYVLALLESPFVHLMGWARDAELPDGTESAGVFKGAYIVPAQALNPLMPINYSWMVA